MGAAWAQMGASCPDKVRADSLAAGIAVVRTDKSMCPAQIAAYGQCVLRNVRNTKKDACAAEFAALRSCFQRAVRARRYQGAIGPVPSP